MSRARPMAPWWRAAIYRRTRLRISARPVVHHLPDTPTPAQRRRTRHKTNRAGRKAQAR